MKNAFHKQLNFMFLVSASMREKINESIKAFEDLTCVRIVPRSQARNLPHNSYIYFVNGYVNISLINDIQNTPKNKVFNYIIHRVFKV